MEIASIPYKSVVSNSGIMKPNYHLNYGKKRIEKALRNNKPFEKLEDVTASVYTGGIFKRVFVEDENFGLPYISAQHMMNADPLDVAKIISKKYTPRQNDMTLRNTQILVSCAGTVGNVRLIGEDLDGVIGSQDIIRVLADNENVPYGFIYAYLASPTAYNYIQSFIYGSVVPRISPDELGKLPVPMLSEPKQQQIHNLIVEASKLRVEANKLMNEAVLILQENLPNVTEQKIYPAKIKSRIAHNSRLEATYNTSLIDSFYQKIEKNNVQIKTIDELSKSVFTPPIFKRVRTDNPAFGVPFLSGSDLLNQYPRFNNYLSRGMKNLDMYLLREGMIAIQDAGTIGYISFITKFLDGVSATNNLVRIIPNEEYNYNYYIYCFFKTEIGQKLLKNLEFGSVQKHIDNYQISDFRIPIFTTLFDQITNKVKTSIDNLSEGCFLEKKAINLIENEIEQWQES